VPELPEVEVVRRGLVSWVRGRTIEAVEVVDPRSIRRHALGTEDFIGNLQGATVGDVVRRGKFLWMPLLDTGAGAPAGTRDSAGLPQVARNVILSGYPAFPVPLLPSLPVDWAIPQDEVVRQTGWIMSWARLPRRSKIKWCACCW